MAWEKKSALKINFGITGDEKGEKIEEGGVLEGKILSAEETILTGNPHNYTMDRGSGDLVTFLGTASLDRLIKDEVGQLVRIKYIGDIKSNSGFNVKQFEVSVYRPDPEKPAAKTPAKK